ncbi:LysR family transcriptional regulator [Bacterioplanoides sp.]|uniref:LysR family transcriptional regulator n=1 Tax=Bacterioplanoides sp. TaxID=2066072 RepID=UPI003AFFD030
MDSFDGIIEFVAVAEKQSFSAAARELECSTSHVSRQVSRLEQRLGSALVARSTRLVSLTEAGNQYYQQCRELLNGLQQANEQLGSQQYQLNGVLRVSLAGTFAETHVVPALISFAQAHPELRLQLEFDSHIVNFVESGFDFAIRLGQLQDSGLVARKLVKRSMMAAASPAYLERRGIPLHPEHLRHHDCIVNNDHWTFREAGKTVTQKVSGRFYCNNQHALVNACEQGLGIAYMPGRNLSEQVNSGRLISVLEPYWYQDINSWVVYPNRRFLPARARLAIQYLLDHFADWHE